VLNKLKTPFNTAIRLALGAYRTTPINNLLYEANILPLEQKRDLQTAKLTKNLIFSKDTPTHKLVKQRKPKKNPSTIDRTINLCQALNLPYEPVKLHKYQPPWDLPNLIDTTFRAYKKQTTPPETYRKLYEHTKDNHKTHKFIFTDGSKMNSTISYAITTDTYIIKYGILPPYSSVLSAEIIAILVAIDQVKSTRGKFMICSDSLSAIDAIRNTNNNNFYSNKIRSLLTKLSPKIKILWIPGHVGIAGNELADQTAKSTSNMPLIYTPNINLTDINRHLKLEFLARNKLNIEHCNQWYKNINKDNSSIDNYCISFHTKSSRLDQIKIIPLRLGHTKLTHEHFNQNQTSPCPFCPTY